MLKYIAALSLSLAMAAGAVADEKPYKEGPVTSVAWVRVKDGKMYEYINYLKGNYTQQMEALTKAGLVTGYKIYQVTPRRPEDPNLIGDLSELRRPGSQRRLRRRLNQAQWQPEAGSRGLWQPRECPCDPRIGTDPGADSQVTAARQAGLKCRPAAGVGALQVPA